MTGTQILPGGTASLDRIERSDGDGREADPALRFAAGDVGRQVSCPPTVGNVRPAAAVAGTHVQWAELGGHGGGRLEDIAVAADPGGPPGAPGRPVQHRAVQP